MTSRRTQSDFAALFKKHRLKSELETLSEFGDLLAEEGYIYENSLFTRWQNGERIPKDRKLLITIIELFVKRGGLKDENEANLFLEAANQRDLNEKEISELNQYFHVMKQTLPEQIEIFVGREQIIKDVSWMLLNKKKVLLYGSPGVGKTAIGIRIGHLLQDKFPDGVLWLRADLKKELDIINQLLIFLNFDANSIKTTDEKLRKLTILVARKNYLIILDNIDSSELIIKKLLKLQIPILLTSTQLIFDEKSTIQIKLLSFIPIEYIDLSNEILGKPFVEQNKHYLTEIGKLLGYLPISCAIILKQILTNPLNLQNYIEEIRNYSIKLDKINYDNKNLHSSFEVSYNNLDSTSQKALSYASIFEGTDFNSQALAYMIGYPPKSIIPIINRLITYSLIEYSIKNRYRLHPAFKMYLRSKIDLSIGLNIICEYYTNTIKKIKKNGENFFDQELENITGIMHLCIKFGKYRKLIDIWDCIKRYLWYLGKWNVILLLKKSIQKAYVELRDQKGLVNFLGEDISRIYFYMNNQKKLNNSLFIAMNHARISKDNILIGLIEQKYGFTYLDNNKLIEAKSKLEISIKLMEKNGPKKDLIKSYIYLGKTYLKLGKISNASEKLQTALKKSKYYKIPEDIGLSHIFLGQLNIKKCNYSLAIKHFNFGLKIEKDIKRKVVMAMGYEGMAEANKKINKFTLSLYYYRNAYKLYSALKMKKEKDLINKKINEFK